MTGTLPPDEPHVLRPGVVIVAHPPGRLVAVDDRRRVSLPHTAPARALLDRLAGPGAPPPGARDEPDAWRAWSRLRAAGLLVRAVALAEARAVAGAADAGGSLADAATLAHGEEAAAVLRGRLAAAVVVHAPPALRPVAAAALTAARVRVAGARTHGAVHLVLADVAPDPRVVAPLMRRGTPHLVIVRDASGVTVGPFVVPGHTACTGCLEAFRADRDPDQGVLRLLRARDVRRTVPQHEPAVLALALAAAARDVTVWAAGDEPGTWSATHTIPYAGHPAAGEGHVPLRRHPRCGCAWDALAADVG